jgi:polyketide synthase PksN
MPIDTMCSASLTAIHEACEHLLREECELAIAGGVNLYLHPSNYVAMCGMQMLSAQGRCRSFGAAADGMVPGEGVGTVLLKRLSAAIADGDQIHGVIRGTSINHGGKTNGYTVPNPQAQRELIRAALDRAGVNARLVSYVEAHGTGTELGDPIEIAGLTQAFEQDTQDRQYCALGSVKSNIGHAESAAGIAAVTKVLLQMRHGALVPSLHTGELNGNIRFEQTPFVVQRELTEWKRPLLTIDGVRKEHPRIAGISSFGAGGSNAHVVIEEYAPPSGQARIEVAAQRPAVVVLSARDEGRLQERVRQLRRALEDGTCEQHGLADIAYTLQVGRESMDQRLGMLARSIEELRDKLRRFEAGEHGIEDLYRGEVKRNREALSVFTADEELEEAVGKWFERGKHGKLLELWAKGCAVDWNRLYGDVRPRRVPLRPCRPIRLPVSAIGSRRLPRRLRMCGSPGPWATRRPRRRARASWSER